MEALNVKKKSRKKTKVKELVRSIAFLGHNSWPRLFGVLYNLYVNSISF